MRTLALLTLAACDPPRGGPPETTPATDPTSAPTPPDPVPHDSGTAETLPVDLTALGAPPGASVSNGRFATADTCATCHANAPAAAAMRDPVGREVAPHDLWRSAMMANSARDPVWRAQVSVERAATPAAAAAIEAKCLRCHAPMASVDAALVGDPAPTLATLVGGTDRAALGLDGVSCAACHQIEDRDLGTDQGFSGGYTILGQGRIYGPHAAPFSTPMQMHSGFTPVAAAHPTDPALCSTCHDLDGHTLAPDGTETGETVTEQGTWREWSAAGVGTTCQGCHLPPTSVDGDPIRTAIARNPMGVDFPPISPREPFGRHLLVGGNTLGPRLLREYRSVLNPSAPDEALEATEAAARSQLATAATLEIRGARRDGDHLLAELVVTHGAGHKLPSGVPVRRVWVHVRVTDGAGGVVRDLGGWDTRGRLVDEGGAVLASELAGGPVTPHLDTVTDTPQVWEGVLADSDGRPTWALTRAAGWVKDDRLLPLGFDPSAPQGAAVPPVGTAADPDFGPGGDTAHLDLDLGGALGPLTLTATLVYQPLSARWAAEIAAAGTPEGVALDAMLASVGAPPETMAEVATTLP